LVNHVFGNALFLPALTFLESEMRDMHAVGILAAGAQIAGYVWYIRQIGQQGIEPNPVSWMMFAYGTCLLVFLEWQTGAAPALLALPLVCAAMSVVIVVKQLRRSIQHVVDPLDGIIFAADIILTAFYVASALMLDDMTGWTPVFLWTGAILTLVTFVPLLRATWRSPDQERAGPWLLWSFAYLLLFCATLGLGEREDAALLAYPAVNLALHLVVSAIILFASLPKAERRV
jgi:hypothetical protein